MIFSSSQKPQAVKIPFNWVADYVDGTYLSEFDFKTYKENSFYSIEQDKLLRFGLIGQGMKMFYENFSGVFNINGHRLEILYKINNKTIPLTGITSPRDAITYKDAVTDFNLKGGRKSHTSITQISFGYKTKFKIDNKDFFFQPIIGLPSGKSAYIELKLTCSHDLDGYLVFKRQSKEVDCIYAPLKAEVSGQINWTIK